MTNGQYEEKMRNEPYDAENPRVFEITFKASGQLTLVAKNEYYARKLFNHSNMQDAIWDALKDGSVEITDIREKKQEM